MHIYICNAPFVYFPGSDAALATCPIHRLYLAGRPRWLATPLPRDSLTHGAAHPLHALRTRHAHGAKMAIVQTALPAAARVLPIQLSTRYTIHVYVYIILYNVLSIYHIYIYQQLLVG